MQVDYLNECLDWKNSTTYLYSRDAQLWSWRSTILENLGPTHFALMFRCPYGLTYEVCLIRVEAKLCEW